MKINVTKEWFRSRAHLEEGHEIGAGSLHHVGKPSLQVLPAKSGPDDITFGKTVSLLRRNHRWTIAQLAHEAETTSQELIEIEANTDRMPEPSTVYGLAKAFKLPPKVLMQKAGLADPVTSSLCVDSVRYAACSEFKEPLTPDEEEVLQAFLKAITEK